MASNEVPDIVPDDDTSSAMKELDIEEKSNNSNDEVSMPHTVTRRNTAAANPKPPAVVGSQKSEHHHHNCCSSHSSSRSSMEDEQQQQKHMDSDDTLVGNEGDFRENEGDKKSSSRNSNNRSSTYISTNTSHSSIDDGNESSDSADSYEGIEDDEEYNGSCGSTAASGESNYDDDDNEAANLSDNLSAEDVDEEEEDEEVYDDNEESDSGGLDYDDPTSSVEEDNDDEAWSGNEEEDEAYAAAGVTTTRSRVLPVLKESKIEWSCFDMGESPSQLGRLFDFPDPEMNNKAKSFYSNYSQSKRAHNDRIRWAMKQHLKFKIAENLVLRVILHPTEELKGTDLDDARFCFHPDYDPLRFFSQEFKTTTTTTKTEEVFPRIPSSSKRRSTGEVIWPSSSSHSSNCRKSTTTTTVDDSDSSSSCILRSELFWLMLRLARRGRFYRKGSCYVPAFPSVEGDAARTFMLQMLAESTYDTLPDEDSPEEKAKKVEDLLVFKQAIQKLEAEKFQLVQDIGDKHQDFWWNMNNAQILLVFPDITDDVYFRVLEQSTSSPRKTLSCQEGYTVGGGGCSFIGGGEGFREDLQLQRVKLWLQHRHHRNLGLKDDMTQVIEREMLSSSFPLDKRQERKSDRCLTHLLECEISEFVSTTLVSTTTASSGVYSRYVATQGGKPIDKHRENRQEYCCLEAKQLTARAEALDWLIEKPHAKWGASARSLFYAIHIFDRHLMATAVHPNGISAGADKEKKAKDLATAIGGETDRTVSHAFPSVIMLRKMAVTALWIAMKSEEVTPVRAENLEIEVRGEIERLRLSDDIYWKDELKQGVSRNTRNSRRKCEAKKDLNNADDRSQLQNNEEEVNAISFEQLQVEMVRDTLDYYSSSSANSPLPYDFLLHILDATRERLLYCDKVSEQRQKETDHFLTHLQFVSAMILEMWSFVNGGVFSLSDRVSIDKLAATLSREKKQFGFLNVMNRYLKDRPSTAAAGAFVLAWCFVQSQGRVFAPTYTESEDPRCDPISEQHISCTPWPDHLAELFKIEDCDQELPLEETVLPCARQIAKVISQCCSPSSAYNVSTAADSEDSEVEEDSLPSPVLLGRDSSVYKKYASTQEEGGRFLGVGDQFLDFLPSFLNSNFLNEKKKKPGDDRLDSAAALRSDVESNHRVHPEVSWKNLLEKKEEVKKITTKELKKEKRKAKAVGKKRNRDATDDEEETSDSEAPACPDKLKPNNPPAAVGKGNKRTAAKKVRGKPVVAEALAPIDLKSKKKEKAIVKKDQQKKAARPSSSSSARPNASWTKDRLLALAEVEGIPICPKQRTKAAILQQILTAL